MTMQTNGATADAIIERVIALGDLEQLKPIERAHYYANVCTSIGLNPLTQPFMYVKLNGKLQLYAKRDATDQLRKIYAVSVTIVSRERTDDLYVVTARATMPDGRSDESVGAVHIAGLKGESLANAIMKAETKAKRRVTLSICGLGLLDETEVADVKGARPVTVTADGEIVDPSEQLTKQLVASVETNWPKWLEGHVKRFQAAATKADLLEAWGDCEAEIRKLKVPADVAKEAIAAKDEEKARIGVPT